MNPRPPASLPRRIWLGRHYQYGPFKDKQVQQIVAWAARGASHQWAMVTGCAIPEDNRINFTVAPAHKITKEIFTLAIVDKVLELNDWSRFNDGGYDCQLYTVAEWRIATDDLILEVFEEAASVVTSSPSYDEVFPIIRAALDCSYDGEAREVWPRAQRPDFDVTFCTPCMPEWQRPRYSTPKPPNPAEKHLRILWTRDDNIRAIKQAEHESSMKASRMASRLSKLKLDGRNG